MDLRFEGDLSLWQGVALATAITALVCWVYRREVARRGGWIVWLLPFLRMAAVVLIILMLSGPVIRSQVEIGDLSRVLVFVDESQSMSLVDKTMSPERKLMSAQRLGWLSEDVLDTSLYAAAGQFARASRAATDAEEILRTLKGNNPEDATLRARLKSTAEQMKRDLHAARDLLLEVDLIDALNRDLIEPVEQLAESTNGNVSALRQRARDLLSLATLARDWEQRLRSSFAQQAKQLIAENDPEVIETLARFDQLTRWQRIETALCTGDKPLLAALKEKHHVELLTTSGSTNDEKDPRRLWWPQEGVELLQKLEPETPNGPATNLVNGLKSRVTAHTTGQRLAVVLLTDGQHNDAASTGGSPLHLAKLFGSRDVPIFTVGVGASSPPRDLAVLAVQGPQSVFIDDRVHGEILLKDNMPAGKPMSVKIELDGELVWQEQLSTDNSRRRRVEFDFPIKQLVEDRLAQSVRSVNVVSLPLPLTVSVDPIEGELRDDNNSAPLYVRAVTRPRRILLIDGRPRWEFRYLRNLFDRDEHWQVNPVLVGYDDNGDPRIERGKRRGQFPNDRHELFSYDLIVFGEVPRSSLTPNELELINQFVSSRGGGLVFIDGRRGKLRTYGNTPIEPLLPVEWTVSHADWSTGARPHHLALTEHGTREATLRFEGDSEAAARRWTELPPPRWVASARALPGAETLVEAVRGQIRLPAVVLRRFGAGNVLYSAFDETWRWRYEVADHYHQRYWNQLANFVMEPSYAVHDRFVSIDTGGFTFQQGQSTELRVRLRDEHGQPIVEATTAAVLYRDDEIVATVPLGADENAGGVFRGTTDGLPEGLYKVGVRATGFTDEQLTARAAFIVEGDPRGELNVLYCDEELLRQMAQVSGGEYLREEELGQLPERLEHMSDFRVEDREVVLWRSWWWFVPLISLFTVEWAVRKRAGLI